MCAHWLGFFSKSWDTTDNIGFSCVVEETVIGEGKSLIVFAHDADAAFSRGTTVLHVLDASDLGFCSLTISCACLWKSIGSDTIIQLLYNFTH